MRRKDYQVDVDSVFRQLTREAPVGYLGIITPDGYPRVVPVNFAAEDKTIYFHGAVDGEKYRVLKSSPKVTFSIDIPYAVIPSYWMTDKNAGGATHFYKAVLIKGTGAIVDDIDERVRALTTLMEKYQPEGKYEAISKEHPIYKQILKATAVFRINSVEITAKMNFRQKKSRELKIQLIDFLQERQTPIDLKTAEELLRQLGTK